MEFHYTDSVYDEKGDAKFSLSLDDLLVDSEQVDSSIKNKCFLGIFVSTNAKKPDHFYLGQLFLFKYYTFFDASAYQNWFTPTFIVGSGPRNRTTEVLSKIYDNKV